MCRSIPRTTCLVVCRELRVSQYSENYICLVVCRELRVSQYSENCICLAACELYLMEFCGSSICCIWYLFAATVSHTCLMHRTCIPYLIAPTVSPYTSLATLELHLAAFHAAFGQFRTAFGMQPLSCIWQHSTAYVWAVFRTAFVVQLVSCIWQPPCCIWAVPNCILQPVPYNRAEPTVQSQPYTVTGFGSQCAAFDYLSHARGK